MVKNRKNKMQFYDIKTELIRNAEYADGIDFLVTCSAENTDRSEDQKIVATLHGFAIGCEGLSGIDPLFDSFDARDSHASEAFEILVTHEDAIDDLFDNMMSAGCSRIVMLERLNVNEGVRGHRLGLRLMREVRQIFYGLGTSAILQASPEGSDHETDRRSLAQYYKRDQTMGFVELDTVNLAGWMVAWWDEQRGNESDERFFRFRG